MIVDRRINVGQTVVSSLNSPSLFLIAKDLKRLEVWASVNEADIGNIRSGQTVRFTVDAYPGHIFHGVVAEDQPRLNASMNQNIVTYTVVVDTDNSEGKLLPYLTADVEFEVATHKDVLMVPNAALRWHPSPERLAAAGRRRRSAAAAAGERSPATTDSGRRHRLGVEKRSRAAGQRAGDSQRRHAHRGRRRRPCRKASVVVIGEAYEAAGSETTNPFSPQDVRQQAAPAMRRDAWN